jgi:ribosomal protein RSM22 (predicted rRNA methylase)
MVSPDLPPALATGIDELVERSNRARLEAAASRLSDAYRAEGGNRVARTAEEAAAYTAYRAPATYAAVAAVLAQLRLQRPDWRPRSLLDVGAGPGVASWAALAAWPALEHVTLVEAEPELAALGRRLAAAGPGPLAGATWVVGDVTAAAGSFDVVLASYVLNELEEERLGSIVCGLWACTADTFVVVEPGTTTGYRRALAARSVVLAAGGSTLAPCPHDAPCPLVAPDWCHFAVRLPRGEAHRAVKAVSRGFEDEKFSYAALTRTPHPRASARIIRPPQIRSGHVHLELCEPAGIRGAIVSKRDREAYRRARKSAWGDAWEE